jgi:hypothetical protein
MCSDRATNQVNGFRHGFRIKVARYNKSIVQWEANCWHYHGTVCPVAEAERSVLVAKVPQRDIGTPATAIQFSKIQREFVTSAANPTHPAFAVSHTPLAAPTVSAAFGAYLNAIGHSVPAAKVKPVAAAAKFPASNPTPTAAAATTSTSSSPSPSTSGHPGSAFAQMGCGDPVFMHWGVKGIYRTYASWYIFLLCARFKFSFPLQFRRPRGRAKAPDSVERRIWGCRSSGGGGVVQARVKGRRKVLVCPKKM